MKSAGSHSKKLTSCSWRHCQHDVNEKWLTTVQHKKGKNQKSSGSTTGNAGANKDDSTHKNCDENPNSRPSENSGKGIAGKSASNEGSELLKFRSMLATSITELKDTMAGKFDQLEEILTRPDIWTQDTEDHGDASEADADNDSSRSIIEEPPSKSQNWLLLARWPANNRCLTLRKKCKSRRKLTQVLMSN